MVNARTPLVLRYFIWSMLIFAFSMGLWGFRALRALELKTLGISLAARQYVSYRALKEIDMPFLVVPVYGELSDEQYLRVARDVVHHLKKGGARAVIVPLPEMLAHSSNALSLINDIASNSIAILGAPNPLTMVTFRYENRDFTRRSSWWVAHPLHNQRKLSWGVMSAYSEFQTPLVRFIPTGFREASTGTPVDDVAIVALRRYFNIPNDVNIRPFGSRLQLGPYVIPLAKDGISYVRYAYRPRLQWVLAATADIASDSVHYLPDWTTGKPSTEPLQKLWAKHEGKIVLVDWTGVRRFQSPTYEWMYFQLFGAVFQRSFVSIHDEWNVLLITTLVILLSVFSYTMRNSLTVFLSLVLFVVTIIMSIWLFFSHNVIFDPIYVLVPIVLSGCILPIVKTAGEKNIAEATIASLEEENRRLLEIQRRSTQDLHP